MALIDPLVVCDSLLQNIVRSEVFIALRSDGATGAGTADDPYDGNKVGSAYRFDDVMRTRVLANTTVYLGPGLFPTEGYKASSSQGWAALSGLRIIGGGWAGVVSGTTKGVTVLQLLGHASGDNFTVGMDTSTTLNGFELAYLSIDCNLPNTTGVVACALKLNGSHVRIRNVQVFNFGAKGSSPSILTNCTVALIANPSTADTYDTVLSDCIFENPSANCINAAVTCIQLQAATGGSYFHRACVVRNSYINCGAVTGYFRGISAIGGVGTIIEQNEVLNCTTAIQIYDGATAAFPITKDLIIRDNFFYNVSTGVFLNWTTEPGSPPPIGRVVLTSNIVELSTSSAVYGFRFIADYSSSAHPGIGQLVVRQNQLRHTDGMAGNANSQGIRMENIDNAIVEENLINIGTDPANPDNTKAISRNIVNRVKTFNNQSSAGAFLGCWNGTTHDGDLVTDIELGILGF